MTQTQIIPGKRYRVVERYLEAGTTVTTEGVVTKGGNIGESPTIYFEGNLVTWGANRSDRATGRETIAVTIEQIADPLPTTRGSVVLLDNLGGMRPAHLFLGRDGWRDERGETLTIENLKVRDDLRVVYDAGAAS